MATDQLSTLPGHPRSPTSSILIVHTTVYGCCNKVPLKKPPLQFALPTYHFASLTFYFVSPVYLMPDGQKLAEYT